MPVARRYKSPITYRLREIPIKQIKVWKDAQARKLDREGIAELARSIKNEGLQNPPMVQKESKNSYLLMSGQRRLAALKRIGAKKIPVLLLTQNTKYDLEDAKAASVVENLHRNKMNIRDMTQACVFLTESIGKAKAAQSLGISQQTLKKYLGFAAVPDSLKIYVPKELSRDDVTKLYQAIPNVSKAVQIAEKIIPLDQRLRKLYLQTLARSSKMSHPKLLKNAKAKLLQQKVTVELNKVNAKKLQSMAAKNDMQVTDMAGKILSSYLKKR
ncbi:ParB/RepB/Spo0J family partition protein [Nitrosopumilus sp.]|uniref:ParB/RepB/Spo0J family partition protein n=1 Tax=Nitrosopumilus sp. TaxID=2024843 RepID=UPI00292E4461|nr:ParB/RepB/Spo0J family partition protein [Nitrosopumilus sp.]